MVYEERHPDGRGQSLSERTEPMLYPSRLPLPLNQGSLFRKICQVLSKNLAFYDKPAKSAETSDNTSGHNPGKKRDSLK